MAESKMIRAGVVGLGQMGIQHLAALGALTRREVCVYDSNERLLKVVRDVAKRVCPHEDLESLLKEANLRAVFVCTPVQTHEDLVKSVISMSANAVGIFVEKPLTVNYASARDLEFRLRGSKRTNMVGFQKRFNGVFSRTKRLLEDGVLGSVQYYLAHSYSFDIQRRTKGWKFDSPDGGVVLDYGVHMLDLVAWFFGEPRVETSYRKRLFSSSVEDYAHVVLNHQGVVGTVDMGWSMRNYVPSEHSIEIHGTNGAIIATEDQLTLYIDTAVKGVVEAGAHTFHSSQLAAPPSYLLTYPEYSLEDEYFLRSCANESAAQPDFDVASKANQLADEIRRHAFL